MLFSRKMKLKKLWWISERFAEINFTVRFSDFKNTHVDNTVAVLCPAMRGALEFILQSLSIPDSAIMPGAKGGCESVTAMPSASNVVRVAYKYWFDTTATEWSRNRRSLGQSSLPQPSGRAMACVARSSSSRHFRLPLPDPPTQLTHRMRGIIPPCLTPPLRDQQDPK